VRREGKGERRGSQEIEVGEGKERRAMEHRRRSSVKLGDGARRFCLKCPKNIFARK